MTLDSALAKSKPAAHLGKPGRDDHFFFWHLGFLVSGSRQWAPMHPIAQEDSKMHQIILISSKDTEKLKQKARKLKRTENLPHHEALDRVAVEAGFQHWHHVCEGAKQFEPTERAFYAGCIIAMDVKDADGFNSENDVFIVDDNAWVLCRDDLLASLANSVDEDDPQGRPCRETLTPEQLEEWLQDDLMNYTFFRLHSETKAPSINDVLQLVKERSFWPPQFIWLTGEFYDTYDIPATDEDGNIVGVRL